MNLKELLVELKRYYKDADKIEKIIVNCALTAAAADAVGYLVPGVALFTLIISCLGAVWAMYIQISRELGVRFGDGMLKALASAVLTNIAMNLGGGFVLGLVSSIVPGLGLVTNTMITFAVIYLSGVMYVNLLVKMLGRYGSIDGIPDDVNASTLKKDLSMGKNVMKTIFSQTMKDFAKGVFRMGV